MQLLFVRFLLQASLEFIVARIKLVRVESSFGEKLELGGREGILILAGTLGLKTKEKNI